MKHHYHRLSTYMIEKLVLCRNLELEGKYCHPEDIKRSLPALYKRGYVGLKRECINNKDLMVVFITQEGLNYLDYLNKHKGIAWK